MLPEERKLGFWVLRSGSKEWHPLPLHPTLLKSYSYSEYDYYPLWKCFVWKDKLCLKVDADPKPFLGRYPLNYICYVYDPQADSGDHSWQQLKENLPFSYSRNGKNGYHPRSMTPVSSLGDVGNCSVAMAWYFEKAVKIHALLVDNQDYCICGNQCLEEASEAIIPSSFGNVEVNFVDLGKGKVCVLIGGITERHRVLCVLVLGLGLVQEGEKEHVKRLSVEVLVNQVYDMTAYKDKDGPDEPRNSFLYSFSKGHAYPQGTRTIGVISKIDQAANDQKSMAAVQALLLNQGSANAESGSAWIAESDWSSTK